MSSRVVRAVPPLVLGFAAMALVAHAFGQFTRTEWVLWLAPLTVALDGSLLLRVRDSDSVALIPPFDIPAYLPSCITTAALATAGAYTGNRAALLMGAALAILGNALDLSEQPAVEQHQRRTLPPPTTSRMVIPYERGHPRLP